MSKYAEYSHPSYAMVGIYRVTGNPGKLFGSPLPEHYSTVRLRIKRAVRINSSGQDRYHAISGGEIAEIELSPAQFADFVTTMNVGDGVPCTLRYVARERIPNPPDEKSEAEQVRQTFHQDIASLTNEISILQDRAQQILGAKGTVTAQQKRELLAEIRRVTMEVTDNLPFILTLFQEATQKSVQAAKAEVDAFMSIAALQKGFQALYDAPVNVLSEGSNTSPSETDDDIKTH
jgi:ElaB/YqjD/DUF883 family membrane-anchored ribosome-binding protein